MSKVSNSRRMLFGNNFGSTTVSSESSLLFRYLSGEAKAGVVGMSSFGASAPIDRLYKEFGITAEATTALAKRLL